VNEIKFHDSVADQFRVVATDITEAEGLVLGLDKQPIIEGVRVVGYIREGDIGDRQMIVWYEGRYLSSPYNRYNGWHDTSIEEDEVFVPFYPTKPRKVIRYEWE